MYHIERRYIKAERLLKLLEQSLSKQALSKVAGLGLTVSTYRNGREQGFEVQLFWENHPADEDYAETGHNTVIFYEARGSDDIVVDWEHENSVARAMEHDDGGARWFRPNSYDIAAKFIKKMLLLGVK